MYGVLLQALATGLEKAVLPFLEWLTAGAWRVVERRRALDRAAREKKKGAPPSGEDGTP